MRATSAITCRIAARRPRRDAGAAGHNARERDTGERREAGAAMGQHLPDRGQAADTHRRGLSCERPAAGSRPSGCVATILIAAVSPA